jgi:hypothetical protein
VKTETANYAAQRALLATAPVYFVRFYHVPLYTSGTDYAFSVDFSTQAVATPTKTKQPWMMNPEGNTQTVEAELGQSTIGGFKIGLLDVGDEITKYMSNPALTLNGSHSSSVTTITVNEDTAGYPAVGTVEITTTGVIERVRYTGKTLHTFTGCTRGVDGTTNVAHSNTDPVGNGEQIRPGQRMQLFAGYGPLVEADYMSFCKMQVAQRDMVDLKTWVVECEDIQRTLRRNIFLTASTSSVGTGTLQTTAGSAAVVGTGTAFTAELATGMLILLTTGETIAVLSVTDATHFTATQPCAASASGQTFTINPPAVLAGNPIDCCLAVLISTGAFVALTGTITTKTAGATAIVGTGTLFSSELAVGSVIRTADGEIMRVNTITDNTHLAVVQNAILTAAAPLTARKGPAAAPFDLLDAVNGLATPTALVDVTTFTTLRGSDFSADQYNFSINGIQDGKTFIETEFMKTLNCYPVINQTGQYSIKRYKVSVGSPTVTLDQSVLIQVSSSEADRQIINVIQTAYDWNLATAVGVFGRRENFQKGTATDPTMSFGKYGPRTALVIQSQGLRSALGASTVLLDRATEVIRRYAEPQKIVQVDCLYSKHTLEPGDQVNFTTTLVPNTRTGLRGFTAEIFEILDMTPQFGPSGRMRFTLLWVAAIAAQTAPTSGGPINSLATISGADSTPPAVPVGLAAAPVVFIDSDGGIVSTVDISWTANGEADLQGYEVAFKRTADTNFTIRTVNKPATALREIGLAGGVSYDVKIRAFDTSGNFSAFSSVVTFTSTADTTAPGVPTGMSALAIPGKEVLVSWTAVSAADLIGYNVYRFTSNSAGSAVLIASVGIPSGASPKPSYIDGDPTLNYGQTYFYWATAVDRTGNESAKAASAASTTVSAITLSDMDRDAGVELGSFAWYHSAPFGAGSPRDSWREATLEFAYAQTSGDRLEYDILFEGTSDSTLTIGGFDLAAIERGPENAASATSTTLVLNAGASGVDSTYNNMWIEIISNGTAAANGQTRKVTAYVGSTKTATVAAWGTTPTGTISYRIIRLLSVDGGNDQNALSSKPDTTLGARALNQWYHRVITLPSAWNGKTIIGAATAMHTAQASLTQTMLTKNAIITGTGTGNPVAYVISRFAFVDQTLWKYGVETNAGTPVVRLEVIGGAAPSINMVNLGMSRVGLWHDATGYSRTATGDAVMATMTNFVFISTVEDIVRLEIIAALQTDHTGVNFNNAVYRVRENNISGAILFELALSATAGSAGKGTTVAGRAVANMRDFTYWKPGSVGFKTICITASATDGTDGCTSHWGTFKIGGVVKSA